VIMAKRLTILTHPDPFLRNRAKDVTTAEINDPHFQDFLDDLVFTMRPKGIGLAAVQVGSEYNVAVIDAPAGPLYLVNPRITRFGKEKEISAEACLSVPGYFGEVERSLEVDIEFLDRRGAREKITATELLARVFQHELDHLNGILYIDRAKRVWKEEETEAKQ